MLELDRITANPGIMGGKACIRGMRIPVSLVVNLVANGMTTGEIFDDYPDLEPEDIRQALRYASWAADDTVYAPPSELDTRFSPDVRGLQRWPPTAQIDSMVEETM